MQRNLYTELGIKRLKRGSVSGMINGIEPDFFLNGRIQHRRVIGGINGPKARRQRANTLIAIYLDLQNLYCQRVARLRAFNVKRAAERIVTGSHVQGVTGLPDGIAETI